jgi:murein DD-endopeptidase MepM/ murein hydrolase activator NlpD
VRFPLDKKVEISADPESFRGLDLKTATQIPVGRLHPGAFGVERRHHTHEGVDIYGLEGDPVFAMQAGIVTGIQPFTGPSAGFDWWLDTQCVVVENDSGVLIYGELTSEPGLTPGMRVEEGQLLGYLSTVLKHDKGRPMNMLHLERYVSGVRESCGVWGKGADRPYGLLDPTDLLLESAGFGPVSHC